MNTREARGPAGIDEDPEAFEAFYRDHLETVRRFVARRVSDPHLAADLTAEVTYGATAVTPSDLDNGERSAVCAPIGVVTDPADNGGVIFTLDAEYVAAHDSVLHLTGAGGRTSDDWIAVSVVWEDSVC